MAHNLRTSKKRRCKTFTGCWTCRARRVKCDEARPVCKRCTLASRECDGYVVRLAWKDAAQDGLSAASSTAAPVPSRSLLEPSSNPHGTSLSWKRAIDLLNECDNATSTTETQSFGPFSVFCTLVGERSSSPQRTTRREVQTPQDPEPCLPTTNVDSLLSDIDNDQWATHPAPANVLGQLHVEIPDPTHHGRPPELETPPDSGSHTSDFTSPRMAGNWSFQMRTAEPYSMLQLHSPNIRGYLEAAPGSDSGLVESVACTQSSEPSLASQQLPHWLSDVAASHRHLDDHTEPSCQVKLIFHWVNFLCHNMVPVDTVHNPYRQIYLPYAYEGMDTSPSRCSSKAALYNGLCAVAAESLLYLGQASDDITDLLAARHARIALQQLQTSLDELRHETLDSTLAAILMCLMRDTVGGYPRHWRGHVCGALKCLNNLTDLTVQPGSHLHVVLGQFLCIAVFGNVSTTNDLQALISHLPEETTHLGAHHGITKFMLECVLIINRLASSPGPRNLDRALIDRLELRIYSHTLPVAPSDDPPGANANLHVRVTHNYTHVYHYALLIHLQRTLRRRPARDLQSLVRIALCHLENAEEVTRGTNGCILLWPCLTVAAEAVEPQLQCRALAWFKTKRRHGFGNVDTGTEILQKYWAWRDAVSRGRDGAAAVGISWQEFVRDTDLDVVPL